MSNLYNEIMSLNFFKDNLFIAPEKMPFLIWHYTDAKNIKGIIDENNCCFHATRSDALDDVYEGQDLIFHYKSCCDTLLKKQLISYDFYNIIAELKPTDKDLFVYFPNGTFYGVSKAYILCFTLDGDSNYMWDNYANSEVGCCIGILPEDMYDSKLCDFDFYYVLYTDEEKFEFLSNVIQQVYKVCENEPYEKYTSTIQEYIVSVLNLAKYTFKRIEFHNEKEFRAIRFVPTDSVEFEEGERLVEYENKYIKLTFNNPSVFINKVNLKSKKKELCFKFNRYLDRIGICSNII